MGSPEISVVMSVYNGAKNLRQSVDSILSQEGIDFEFIIINDGSTDGTSNILDGYARNDKRVRIIEQENTGLTKALIRGCDEARGKSIARQDVGDISLPGKLMRQLEAIRANHGASMVSCGTRFVGPCNEVLFEVNQDQSEATSRLLTQDIRKIRGPSSHPSVVFSRKLYNQVGGYRAEFYFAQDLDLWTRLVEHGKHIIVPETLYQATFSPGSISGANNNQQVMLAEIILECAASRRSGKSEGPLLEKAGRIKPVAGEPKSSIQKANALYFIGTCLRERGDRRAKKYFLQALQAFPLHLKSVLRLLQA